MFYYEINDNIGLCRIFVKHSSRLNGYFCVIVLLKDIRHIFDILAGLMVGFILVWNIIIFAVIVVKFLTLPNALYQASKREIDHFYLGKE